MTPRISKEEATEAENQKRYNELLQGVLRDTIPLKNSKDASTFPTPKGFGQITACKPELQLYFSKEAAKKFREDYAAYEVVFKPPPIDTGLITLLSITQWPLGYDKKRRGGGKASEYFFKEKDLYRKQLDISNMCRPMAAMLDDIEKHQTLTVADKQLLIKRCTDTIQQLGVKFRANTELRRRNVLEAAFTDSTVISR